MPDLIEELTRVIQGDVLSDTVSLGVYATDASVYEEVPRVVVVPRDENDVRQAVAISASHGATILPRGGGTSLAGQASGPSLILDFSKYMDRLVALDVSDRRARVQPGMVRDVLNEKLLEHRLHFGPDPATSSRANFGGMIGNNSSGTRSILYGKTVDHVVALKVLLVDGTIVEFTEQDAGGVAAKVVAGGREGELYAGMKALIEAQRDEIIARFPKVMRRVGGYNLDELLDGNCVNLAKLICGSEGTLGVILEATVSLDPLPNETCVGVYHFADLLEAIRAVEPILAFEPACVEVLDGYVLSLARDNHETRPHLHMIQGEPSALLIVEYHGSTHEEALNRARQTIEALQEAGLGHHYPICETAEDQASIWTVRKAGLGLLLGMKGDRKPLAFIEDAAIPVPVLPEYIEKVQALCNARNVPVCMYGHASVGVIHVRPVLDLRSSQDIEHFKQISQQTYELVKHYKGSWSGEHGDGRVRGPYNQDFFGDQLYQAFIDVKHLFDPENRMNPGKIIECGPIDAHLRYGETYRPDVPDTHFHFREDGGFAAAVELCSGVGACRKTQSGTMCPSFMATRDEEHSTRGRANAMRLAMTGRLGKEQLCGPRIQEALALCLSCKGCKAECPSNVDLARLKSEVRQMYYDAHGSTRRDRLIANSADSARTVAGWKAPIVNALAGSRAIRGLTAGITGMHPGRVPPKYAARPLEEEFEPHPGTRGKVALFADTYANFHEPQTGRAAVRLLRECGYEVLLANVGCCQRPRISHGFLREAKALGTETALQLDGFLREGIPVVVLEPSCASALVDDLPDLLDDVELGERMRKGILMIDQFLAAQREAGVLSGSFEADSDLLIHGHCHQKALFGTQAMKTLLAGSGKKVAEIAAGCCGMAGSFGYETEHYELSKKIAADRLLPAVEACPADTELVACGFSCRHQIADLSERTARHWVELVHYQDSD